jgi:hypothetical protein
VALVVVLLPGRGGQPAAARPVSLDVRATRVVTAFLDASVRGDTGAACRFFPDYMPCARGDDVPRPERYELGSVSLADREHPVVFANIEGVRGYFVLERRGETLVIVSANAD